MIRAFDARTGAEVWRFNSLPREGGLGSDTWQERDHSRILEAQIIGPEWHLMSSVACYSFPPDLPHRIFMGPQERGTIYLQIA